MRKATPSPATLPRALRRRAGAADRRAGRGIVDTARDSRRSRCARRKHRPLHRLRRVRPGADGRRTGLALPDGTAHERLTCPAHSFRGEPRAQGERDHPPFGRSGRQPTSIVDCRRIARAASRVALRGNRVVLAGGQRIRRNPSGAGRFANQRACGTPLGRGPFPRFGRLNDSWTRPKASTKRRRQSACSFI